MSIKKTRLLIPFLLAFLLVCLFGIVATAEASNPAIHSTSPADGYTTTASTVNAYFRIEDQHGPFRVNVSVSGGTANIPYINYPIGHMEEDSGG